MLFLPCPTSSRSRLTPSPTAAAATPAWNQRTSHKAGLTHEWILLLHQARRLRGS